MLAAAAAAATEAATAAKASNPLLVLFQERPCIAAQQYVFDLDESYGMCVAVW